MCIKEWQIPRRPIKLTKMALEKMRDRWGEKRFYTEKSLSTTHFNLEVIIKHQIMAFTDHQTILTRNQKEPKRIITAIEKEEKKFGLVINLNIWLWNKCKKYRQRSSMILVANDVRECVFERVQKFCYLGVTIEEIGNTGRESKN